MAHSSSRRRWCLLALAAATTLAACTSQVSDDLSIEALGKSGKAVIVMAASLDSNAERSCTEIGLAPLNRAERTELYVQLDGQRLYKIRLKLGTGYVVDAGNEIIGSMQIEPGTYAVAAATCRPSHGTKLMQAISSDPKGFATFTVAAGEVVNLGKLVILEVDSGSGPPTERYNYVSLATALKTDPRARLNKDLAARLVDRLLELGHPPLPQAELVRICQQRRANPSSIIGPSSPPVVCALAGL